MNVEEKYRSLFSFIKYEQKLSNFEYYNPELRRMFIPDIPDIYIPGNSGIFKLPYYAIPLDSPFLLYKERKSHVEFLKQNLIVEIENNYFYPFFVHPTSVSTFNSIIPKEIQYISESDSSFYATATSSYRTLLVWNSNDQKTPFFVKVSLLKNIANGSRHIDWFSARGQFEASLATYECLPDNSTISLFNDIAAIGVMLEKTFDLPESLTVDFGPRSVTAFGTIIREIPEKLLQNKCNIASIASLTSIRRKPFPWLVHLSKEYSIEYATFLNNKIIYPLLKDLLYLVNMHGIGIEPHCQNMMAELTLSGELTGNFYYRDFDVTGIDRARFPFLHREKWDEYRSDRPVRITHKENVGDRLGIVGIFAYHFNKLLLPCLQAGIECSVINENEKQSLLTEVDKYWKECYNSFHPFFKEDYSKITPLFQNPIIRTHISEIPIRKHMVSELPGLDNFYEIRLGIDERKINYSSYDIYITDSGDYIIVGANGYVETLLLHY